MEDTTLISVTVDLTVYADHENPEQVMLAAHHPKTVDEIVDLVREGNYLVYWEGHEG